MRCPRLYELPPSPWQKTGWPWTEESTPLQNLMPDGQEWPRISIVTPSFNQGSFIEDTIRSVLLQGYPNLEYFIFDGASIDNSAEIIKKYEPWLSYWVSEPDGGQSDVINRGLKKGSGILAAWINSDDMLCRNALVEQMSRHVIRPKTVYIGICTYIDATGNILSRHRGKVHSLEDLVRVRTVWRSGSHIVQPEVLFPRELALTVGGLDRNNYSTMDYDLWGKLLLAGATFQYSDIPFAMFREHQNQKTHDVLRQTRSLLDTAKRLVLHADCFSEDRKNELLADLKHYGIAYEKNHWKGSGRLARLGLPRGLVSQVRRIRALVQQTIGVGSSYDV